LQPELQSFFQYVIGFDPIGCSRTVNRIDQRDWCATWILITRVPAWARFVEQLVPRPALDHIDIHSGSQKHLLTFVEPTESLAVRSRTLGDAAVVS
jgi:hypothetical protein